MNILTSFAPTRRPWHSRERGEEGGQENLREMRRLGCRWAGSPKFGVRTKKLLRQVCDLGQVRPQSGKQTAFAVRPVQCKHPKIAAAQERNRQVKNFFAVILLAAGTPMILMGDEVRRTQRGNNNAFCQDSDISWFDWSLLERHGDIYRFVKSLNEFRQRRDVVVAEETALSLNEAPSPGAHRMARSSLDARTGATSRIR